MRMSDKQKKSNAYACEMKQGLLEKLKYGHYLWSYDNSSISDMPEDFLIELVMLHLDIDDINLLFQLYPYSYVKKAWIENVVAQGERYETLNRFFAWYYFHAKEPKRYVRSLMTRQLHKRIKISQK